MKNKVIGFLRCSNKSRNVENKVIAFLRYINTPYNSYFCGYVGVKDNSMFPKCFQNSSLEETVDGQILLDDLITVHKGITFAGKFDCSTPVIPITDIPSDYHTYYFYGFDLNHADDEKIGNDYQYAKAEVLSMKEQMEKLIAKLCPSTGD